MRFSILPPALLVLLTSIAPTSAFDISPFFSTLLQNYIPSSNFSSPQPQTQQILKRQTSNACPTSFNSCSNLGAPNLCCHDTAICSADFAGHVACCPSGAACSGTISGIVTAGSLNSNGVVVAGATDTGTGAFVTATTTGATTTAGLVVASTATTTDALATSGGGFVIASGTTVATPAGAGRSAQIVSLAAKCNVNYTYADVPCSHLLHKASSDCWSICPFNLRSLGTATTKSTIDVDSVQASSTPSSAHPVCPSNAH